MNIVILIALGFVFTIIGRVADPDMSVWRFAYVIAGCFFAEAYDEIRSKIKRKKASETVKSRWHGGPDTTPTRPLRGPFECECCGAELTEWCKEDCEYLDPYDWR